MYVPDTLERLNEEEIARYCASDVDDDGEKHVCDFCSEDADQVVPVYNPADGVRDVKGAYGIMKTCEACRDNGHDMEEHFYCPYCGDLFIVNHSWDVVAAYDENDGYVCQACYMEHVVEAVELWSVLEKLRSGKEGDSLGFIRANAVPGHEEFFSGEYSGYSDFPGYTSLSAVADAIEEAAEKEDVGMSDPVYPLLNHGYQFSVSLSVWK